MAVRGDGSGRGDGPGRARAHRARPGIGSEQVAGFRLECMAGFVGSDRSTEKPNSCQASMPFQRKAIARGR
jgi:hypothetical protein